MDANIYHPRRTAARWAVMPKVTGRALRHASLALGPAADALKRASADLIVVHFHGIDGKRRRIGTTVWKAVGGGYHIDDGHEVNQAVIYEIAGALNEAVRELAARWPDNARPRTIGIALDGNAIVFNTSYPSAEGHAWLDEHLAGRAPAAILHDCGGNGLLTRLCQNDR